MTNNESLAHSVATDNKDQEIMPIPVTDSIDQEANIEPQSCNCDGSSSLCQCNYVNDTNPSFIYAVGNIQPYFPTHDLQKEYEAAVKKLKLNFSDYYEVFTYNTSSNNKRTNTYYPYRYIAEQLCWVFSIENVDGYIAIPHSQTTLTEIINSLQKPEAAATVSLCMMQGQLGSQAPEGYCGNLRLPLVLCSHFKKYGQSETIGFESLKLKANGGQSNNSRAINYFSLHYTDLIEEHSQLKKSVNSEIHLAGLHTEAADNNRPTIINIILEFKNNETSLETFYYCAIDVSTAYPFLESSLRIYIPATST
jgi:hypothetical protein